MEIRQQHSDTTMNKRGTRAIFDGNISTFFSPLFESDTKYPRCGAVVGPFRARIYGVMTSGDAPLAQMKAGRKCNGVYFHLVLIKVNN